MREAPIIETLLDTDFYKFTMAYAVHERWSEVKVRYALRCRTADARLAELVDADALSEQLEHVRTLKFHDDELEFLRTNPTRPLGGEFIELGLGRMRLADVAVAKDGDGLRIEVAGRWFEAILWETYVLSIVNDLYARGLARERGLRPDDLWDEGDRRLNAKIDRLKGSDVKLVEFGTRRRFCRDWQEHVLNVMTAKLPKQVVGTSNVVLARRYGLKPIGTMAHELFMVVAALAPDDAWLRASQGLVLDLWQETFGDGLSIALSDTFGADAFFRDFAGERGKLWRGVRHDSGDPFAFGERVIRFYADQRIDPRTKTIVFSDGLDVESVLRLHERFDRRIGVLFGWGTDLTNDVGLPTLSLVMKVVEAGGRPTVKLSDDAGKHTGPPDEIARYLRVFG
ncbi:MAG TPA: nicotinate phosphoribosyltransferase [Candidatus Baltobacteraceae bacterium]|nr:nicotinate phosphoribosyltransferase [Candidatus Baltobacteraceae bacterium]